MRRVRAVAIGLAMLAGVALGHAAKAQEAVFEYAQIGHALFCAQDIAELDKAVKLTTAQKEAAESLMRGAAGQARTVYAKMMRACSEKSEAMQEKSSDPEAYQAAYKAYMQEYMKMYVATNKEIVAIEREALTDLRGALKAEQVEKGWPTFERARRRLMLMNGAWMGMGRSPRGYVQGIKLSAQDTSAAEEILGRYETELDPLLVERSHGLGRMQAEIMEKNDWDMNAWQTVWQRPDLMAPKINKLNVKTSQAIEKALSEDGRKLFLRQRVGVEFNGWFQRPASDERVKQTMKVASLSDEQRDEIKALVTKADEAMFEVALGAMREADDAAMKEETPKPEDVQTKTTERQQKAQTQITALVKSLRAVLTTAQQEELDFGYGRPAGQDPFKTDRIPVEESDWNKDPSKDSTESNRR